MLVSRREWIEADMIAGPSWLLQRRAFPAAGGTCASPQFATSTEARLTARY